MLDKAFKGTVVNRALLSLHEGSLKITLTVPLKANYDILKTCFPPFLPMICQTYNRTTLNTG